MSATIPQLPNHALLEIRPGDEEAATAVQGWLGEYATSRDPVLREQIILAYLGLADRLANRYRHSRGSTPEDLRQTARAGLVAAIDRYDPAKASRSSPSRWPVWSASSNATCAIPAGGCTCPGRSRNERCGCAGRPTSCTSAGAAHPPPASWPSSWGWARRRSWRGWRLCPAARRCRWISRSATPTFDWATWWRRRKPGRSQKTCWPCLAWCRSAGAGARGHCPAVLPGPGPVRDRGPGRLLPDACLSVAAPGPGPDACPADATVTRPRCGDAGHMDGAGHPRDGAQRGPQAPRRGRLATSSLPCLLNYACAY